MPELQHQRSVGRPREFDEDAVLEAAMCAFWHKGYEATSLADLCECTGLHKGSLYQTFGGKHELFMRSIQHYSDKEFREVAKVAFTSASPIANIRALVNKVCGDVNDERGCLMINTMVELAPHDPEVKAAIDASIDRRLQATIEILTQAQKAGEVRAELQPEKLARQLMVTLAGVAATVKGFLHHDEAIEVMNELIDSWI
jgi:TetR/AcrR family transcriptional repressor of nem operon